MQDMQDSGEGGGRGCASRRGEKQAVLLKDTEPVLVEASVQEVMIVLGGGSMKQKQTQEEEEEEDWWWVTWGMSEILLQSTVMRDNACGGDGENW